MATPLLQTSSLIATPRRRVNIKKSVATIEAIEKYGRATKKRSHLIQLFKEKLHLTHEDPVEKQKAEDKEDLEKIEKDEHDKPTDVGKEESEEGDDSLPGDGKRAEDMTEDERLERGLALVARAWERGMQDKIKKGAKKDGGGKKANGGANGRQEHEGGRANGSA